MGSAGGRNIVHEPIYDCNSYYNSNLPSLNDMYDIAWEVKTDSAGKKVGFSPPDKVSGGRPR